MNLAEKISSDILTTTIVKLSLKVRGLIIIPLLTIGIGVGDYGAYTQAIGIATLLGNFCLLGTDQGFVRYIHQTDQPGSLFTSLLLIAATVSMAGALLMVSLADTLAIYTLSESGFASVFVVAAFYVPATIFFHLGRGYYQAHRRIKRFSIYEAVEVYLFVGCLVVAVLKFDATITQAFAIVVVARIITAIGIFVGIIADGGLALPSITILRECLTFSIGTMGHLLSQSLLDKMDRVLLGYFLGASAVGVYSAAYSVSYLILLYFRPLGLSFFPEFSKLWEDQEFKTIQKYSIEGIRYAAVLALPSIAGFALIGSSILGLLSTSEVAQAGAVPLVMLSGAMFCKGIGELYTQLFFAVDESSWPAVIQGSSAILNIILNIIMIPSFGIYGAVLASLFSFGVAMVLSAALFQRWLRILPQWKDLGRITIATAVMYGVFSIILVPWQITLLLAPIIYAVVLVGIGGLKQTEIQNLIHMIR